MGVALCCSDGDTIFKRSVFYAKLKKTLKENEAFYFDIRTHMAQPPILAPLTIHMILQRSTETRFNVAPTSGLAAPPNISTSAHPSSPFLLHPFS